MTAIQSILPFLAERNIAFSFEPGDDNSMTTIKARVVNTNVPKVKGEAERLRLEVFAEPSHGTYYMEIRG
jgi:hypothetical protein